MGSANNWLAAAGFSGAGAVPSHGDEPPKLEDFLGVQQQETPAPATGRPFGAGGANSIGLSMIKNWLRSQPAPAASDSAALVTLPEADGKVANGGESGGAVVEAAMQKKAPAETFGQRTSVYRGVTKHRWTGRYEAHLWDNSCRREGQTRKGRQGGYDKEEKAARAYDLAALKYWGNTTTTNFPVTEYEKELEEMKDMTRQEYVASLRRHVSLKSSGFSRGASMYRGVTRHHQHGRWQARIGRVAGNKDLYLGTFSTQEEAAEAYDIAAIKFRGLNAVTNFDMSRYDVKSIIESTVPIGSGATKRTKDVPEHAGMGLHSNGNVTGHLAASNLLTDGIGSYGLQHDGYGGWAPFTYLPAPLQQSNGLSHSGVWCKQEEHEGVAAARNLHNLQYFTNVSGTHNFFQPSALQDETGFTEMPSRSLDSNSAMYNGGVSYHGAVGRGGYAMPVARLASCYEDDGGTVPDLYNSQKMYYFSQDSPLGDSGKDNAYVQGVEYENWVSSEPVMAQKATDALASHGLPLFSLK
ncbi:hypothetical protein EJB05_28272, partial [Eragrostis curvula]